ncbi:hypothetical protein MAM1_0004c00487 [Mucor ambiguus]|uniref:Ricin B lectin domain-containing protein n=1 Tax=Mucor ambiguus TaxID=91626 RepID=A0A0C9LZZ7_9FUNG|nr:hypothetical protein MAM1_0004c00487 [Mucor ambiguus]
MFPNEGYFFLKSQKTGLVLDTNGENEAGSKLVIRPKGDESEVENQLWTFEQGYLISKKTSLVMDIEGGDLRSDKKVLQFDRKKTMAHNQRWGIRDGFIYPVADPRLVMDTKEDSGSPVTVTYRRTEDNDLQQWYLEPFEGDY